MSAKENGRINERTLVHMNGAGNSFFIIDALTNPLAEDKLSRADFAKRICTNTNGIKADGLVILQKSSRADVDFEWDFFNSDGSFAEMCGNASRCVSRFYLEKIKTQSKVRFLTSAGVIEGEIAGPEQYRVQMPALKEAGQLLELGTAKQKYFFINTGVPHLVVESAPSKALALELRASAVLGPAGSNVTFFEQVTETYAKAVTFERGVNDFTLACGTGATAAAAFARQKNPAHQKFSVEMPGGILEVAWLSLHQASLSGPAQFDFEGRVL